MSFLNKVFGRKKDDFSYDDEPITGYDPAASSEKVNNYLDSTGNTNSFDSSTAQPDPYATQTDPYGASVPQDGGLPPDSTSTPQDPFTAPMSQQQMPSGATAQQMADKYIQRQEQTQQAQPQNPALNQNAAHKDEVLNLKLDSMKNQLDAINQRIQKIEQLLQQNANKRW